jgi:hypothetical protein
MGLWFVSASASEQGLAVLQHQHGPTVVIIDLASLHAVAIWVA